MKRLAAGLVAGVMVAVAAPLVGRAPAGAIEAPVAHGETQRGAGIVTTLASVAPSPKVVDGNLADWTGTAAGFSGAVISSRGELIYTDHLFDAYGADDGGDVERLALLDPGGLGLPEAYRLDPLMQQDPAGVLGIPTPENAKADEQYGNGGFQPAADLRELRLAATATSVLVAATTTTMTAVDQTGLLLLFDTVTGGARPVPFNAGLTTGAEVAVLLRGTGSTAMNLVTGTSTAVTAVSNPTGFANAIEASIPRSLLGTATPKVAAATGVVAGAGLADLTLSGPNVSNVAFRTEPVRIAMEKVQALTLHSGTMDPLAIGVDLDKLAAGRNQSWRPGPGYHERVFASSPSISKEGGTDGVWQHYGVYVPSAYVPGQARPLTMWLHWRGGKAHSAAAVAPRIMRDFGENRGNLVISPRGRGTSSWYLGLGQVDLNEVWADSHQVFTIDENRTYVTGHSMGGFGSYLMAILYPDRFAAALPVAGPVTQGAWTGADFAGCDSMSYDEYSPCYVGTNESDPRTQHTRRLLQNLRNVPIGIYQGGIDELVPTSGVTRQVEELVRLGYRHRYYMFPTYEHYSHPVVDEWAEGGRYLDTATRDPNPARVSYVRDMPFERTVEMGPSQLKPAAGLSFDFDHAYWMSELTAVDPTAGVATFDGTSLAKPNRTVLTVPEAGGPASVGQAGPYAMTGLSWLADPTAAQPPASNAFVATLTGAVRVRLDVARMGLSTAKAITGTVTTDQPNVSLRLAGSWSRPPTVVVNGSPRPSTYSSGVLTTTLSTTGPSTVVVTPRPAAVDFDGDGRSDPTVFRASTGTWHVGAATPVAWGASGDRAVPGDYDGDGDVDMAVWRPATGIWYVRGASARAFGQEGDVPVPADYDGDGDTDLAVYRPATPTSHALFLVEGRPGVSWGIPGDLPVPADYDGDGSADLAVYRPSTGYWYIRGIAVVHWGSPGDVAVPGDYDGDGRTDITVWRPSTGAWYVRNIAVWRLGTAADTPMVGDYTGDGKDDPAVWSAGTFSLVGRPGAVLGAPGDVPVSGRVG